MAVAVNKVAQQFLNVQAGVAIPVAMQAFEASDIRVIYGITSRIAVQNVDYTISLANDFNTFTIVPTASLIAKINALIAADPSEQNYITVRRELDLLTESTAALSRYTPFTSREHDRSAMRDQQLNDRLNRSLQLGDRFVGGSPLLTLAELEPDRVLMVDPTGTQLIAGPNANEIENAQAYAERAEAAAATADITFDDLPALLAAPRSYPLGSIIATHAEGFAYEVASSDPDLTTAGGTMLRVLPGHGGYNLRAFGARGKGVTDDSAATLRWLRRSIAANARAKAPAGDYLLNTAAQFTCANERFEVVGDGENVTRFIVPAANTIGGLLITSTGRSGQAAFERFSIIKRGTGGVGLRYTQPEGGNQHQRGLICRDVTVAGENKASDTFTEGYFDFSGAWRPLIQNCKASGPFIGVNMSDGSARYAAGYGYCLDGCYDPTLDSSYAWGQHTSVLSRMFAASVLSVSNVGGGRVRLSLGEVHPFSVGFRVSITGTASYDGVYTVQAVTATTLDVAAAFTTSQTGQITMSTGPEAIRIVNSVLAECRRSLFLHRPTGREPVLWMDNCHINWRDAGLVIDGVKLVTISHLHSYNQDTANLYSGTASDILLKNCSEYIITSNTFHYDGAADRIGVFVESNTAGEGDNGIVANNVFSGVFETAVWLTNGVSGAMVGPNIYGAGVARAVNDVSTVNVIIDGLASTSGTWLPSLTFGGSATGISYTSRSGVYRVSGGLMHFQISMALSSKGTATGVADISLPETLPGAEAPQPGGQVAWAEYVGMSGMTTPAGRATSAHNLRLTQTGASVIANLTDANFSNASAFTISGSVRLA